MVPASFEMIDAPATVCKLGSRSSARDGGVSDALWPARVVVAMGVSKSAMPSQKPAMKHGRAQMFLLHQRGAGMRPEPSRSAQSERACLAETRNSLHSRDQ